MHRQRQRRAAASGEDGSNSAPFCPIGFPEMTQTLPSCAQTYAAVGVVGLRGSVGSPSPGRCRSSALPLYETTLCCHSPDELNRISVELMSN